MAKNPEAVEDPLDGQLPRDIVGVVEHHIEILEVPVTDLWEYPTELISIHSDKGANTVRAPSTANDQTRCVHRVDPAASTAQQSFRMREREGSGSCRRSGGIVRRSREKLEAMQMM